MKKKPIHLVHFRDPNLSDRDMLLLILYELAQVKTEVKFVKEYLAMDASQKGVETDAKLFKFCHDQAFAEMEADMLQFVRRLQNVEGN